MASVERTLSLNASADAVWTVIGNFGDMSWHPAAASTTTQDRDGVTVRNIAIKGGGAIMEKLTGASAASYSYAIIDSPLPVTGYQSTLKVEDKGGTAHIVWSATFEPAGVSEEVAANAVAGIYEGGFAALKGRF